MNATPTPHPVTVWMRHEERSTERRAPVVPPDAARLVQGGLIDVVVEESPQRVFPAADYTAAGCRIVPTGSWVDAPDGAFVLGLKELPDADPPVLRHRHIYFGHAYKGQADGQALLRRFVAGGGALLDLESLVDEHGHRLAAFGYWAGYVGAALAVLQAHGRLVTPLEPTTKEALDAALAACTDGPAGSAGSTGSTGPAGRRSLVIGVNGRSGSGAVAAFAVAGIPVTGWGLAQTKHLDRAALIGFDILVNTVLTTHRIPPFVRPEDVIDPGRRLSLISDVTCDVTSDLNVLPIYDAVTTWEEPVRSLCETPPLDIVAIDNLPSLLPREASEAFSAELTPELALLRAGSGQDGGPWARARVMFDLAVSRLLPASTA